MKNIMESIRFTIKSESNRMTEIRESNITSIPGIEKLNTTGDDISLTFNPYLISGMQLKQKLNELGYIPYIKKKEKFYKRWIMRLAQSNHESFDDKKLDCCNLSK